MYIHLFKWSYIYFYVSIFFLIWFINEIFLLLTPYFSVFHKIVNTHDHTEYLACCDRQPDVVYSKQIRQYHNALILAIVSSSVANIFKKSIYDITSSILCCINCLWKSTNLSMPLFLTLFNKHYTVYLFRLQQFYPRNRAFCFPRQFFLSCYYLQICHKDFYFLSTYSASILILSRIISGFTDSFPLPVTLIVLSIMLRPPYSVCTHQIYIQWLFYLL